jgi:hypothetical protein
MTRDVVHSAMGECEAAHLARLGLTVAMDEPYQHYQFARRADVLAWDLANSRLLHNREQVTNRGRPGARRRLQRETCLTLPPAIGERLGVGPRGWQTVSHVLVALWSSEVLHALRMRTATFRALCPDPADTFAAWWSGALPPVGSTSTLVILDPALAIGWHRRWIGLDDLDAAAALPRLRGRRRRAQPPVTTSVPVMP